MQSGNTAAVLIPVFHTILDVVIAAMVSLAGLAIRKYVTNQIASTLLVNALDRASGLMLAHGQQVGDQFLQNEHVNNTAMQIGMAYLADKTKELNLNEKELAEKLSAVIATKLALATPIPPPGRVPLPEPVAPVTPVLS